MNGTDINLTIFGIFAAVARNKSFRKAAIELAVPVATISRKISNLEEQLGVQLLQRTTRSVGLTEVGEQLFNDIADPLLRLEEVTRRAASQQDLTSGLVKIATTYTLAETNILPILPQLKNDWPNINVQLMLSEEVVDIRFQHIDFAVRAGKLNDLSLIARKLCTHYLVRYSTPEMLTKKSPGLIVYGDELKEAREANIEVKDMRMVLQLVLANLGEAWMPDTLCLEYERRGELIRVGAGKKKSFDIFLVFGSKKFVPKRARIVMDAVIEHAKKFNRSNNQS